MRRGTTPTLKFSLYNKDGSNFDTNLVENIRVAFAQKGVLIIEKDTDACDLVGNTVSVTLSQEETLLFDYNAFVEIQLKIKTQGERVVATDTIRVACGKILCEEII